MRRFKDYIVQVLGSDGQQRTIKVTAQSMAAIRRAAAKAPDVAAIQNIRETQQRGFACEWFVHHTN